MKVFVPVILAVLATACFGTFDRNARPTPIELNEEDSAHFLVVSRVIEKFGPDRRLHNFVSIENHDPSPELLAELHKHWPTLRPVSESHVSKTEPGNPVMDRSTNQPGVKWQTHGFATENGRVKLKGGYYSSNLGGAECEFLLKKENAGWKIVSEGTWLAS